MIEVLLLASTLVAGGTPATLLPPLVIDDGLSASFGELRGDRLHTGIDYRTRRTTGFEVRAAARGRVIRVKEQWRGYGLAVYIEHPSGLVTVYAHLDRVSPELEERLASRRRKRRSRWAGDLELTPPVTVVRGQTIAWSGESGAGFPHLHFEVRRGMATPVDPFTAGLPPARDPEPPVATTLIAIPDAIGSRIDGCGEEKAFPLERGDDGVLRPHDQIAVSGPVRFLLLAHDTIGAGNRAGLGALRAELDGQSWYDVRFDTIPFGQHQTSGTVLDLNRSGLQPTEYAYRLPGLTGARVPFATGAQGALELSPGRHRLVVSLGDASGKQRSPTRVEVVLTAPAGPPARAVEPAPDLLAGEVARGLGVYARTDGIRLVVEAPSRPAARLDDQTMALAADGSGFVAELALAPGSHVLEAGDRSLAFTVAQLARGRATALEHDGLRLDVPRGAAWGPATVLATASAIEHLPPGMVALSAAVRVAPAGHPLRRQGRVTLAREHLPPGAAVFRHDPRRQRWVCLDLGNSADIRRLGTFALLDDRSGASVVEVTPPAGASVAPGPIEVSVRIEDDGCGIPEHGIRLWIDDTELDELYDPDRSLAAAAWIATPGRHRLRAEVRDFAGNVVEHTSEFTTGDP